MRKRLILSCIALLASIATYSQKKTQHYFNISLGPTLLWNESKYLPANNDQPLLIHSKRRPGVSLSAFYQADLANRFFLRAGTRFFLLSNTVDIEIAKSGFGEQVNEQYGPQWDKNPFEYFIGFGLQAGVGYNQPISARSSLSLMAGGHFDVTPFPAGDNGIILSNTTVYREEFINPGDAYIGVNVNLQYNLNVGIATLFAALEGNVDLDGGGDLTGNFVSYPSLPVKNWGTVSLSRNYSALLFGIKLPLAKEKRREMAESMRRR